MDDRLGDLTGVSAGGVDRDVRGVLVDGAPRRVQLRHVVAAQHRSPRRVTGSRQGLLEVDVEGRHDLRGPESPSAEGEHARLLRGQQVEDGAALGVTEGRLAVLGEVVRDGHPEALDQRGVAVDEGQAGARRQLAPDGGLAGAHEADEDDHQRIASGMASR